MAHKRRGHLCKKKLPRFLVKILSSSKRIVRQMVLLHQRLFQTLAHRQAWVRIRTHNRIRPLLQRQA
ncbi:unnamed protein product [Toxocara canis]|uniref:Uncharacterized protein n=1 Tax=Toxocara canis TaxID=6265 RepID=A0A3P7F998_TOXCA|nr:unnamed protein product [Toxocara canis]